jgi:2-hydroxychromene-2-carboxylate isomerase
MARLEYFFDYVSPFAYLADSQLPALVERTGAELVYRPFLLGGVMKASGNSPPFTVPAKGAWVVLEGGGFPAFHKAVFSAMWKEGVNVGDAEGLRGVLEKCGLDAAAVLERCGEPEIKDALRRNTEEAVERGAFGAPTFFVGDQMFWGNDRLDFVEEALRA